MGLMLVAAVLVVFGSQLWRVFLWMCKTMLKLLMRLVLLGMFLQLFE